MTQNIRWRLATLLLFATAIHSLAATLVVTNTDDSGAGSLRQAIADANPAGGDTISFSVTGTITLSSGELVIDKALIISGPGASQLTVSGNSASRVCNVTVAGPAAVTFSGLTIADGKVTSNANGAGISSTQGATLNVTNCTLSNNQTDVTFSGSSTGNSGGGIFNMGGSLNVRDSTLSGNGATSG